MTIEISGMLSWGNGEPCPICGKKFKRASLPHLFDEHKEEVFKELFPEEKNDRKYTRTNK